MDATYYADLHLHSRYSRATAADLDLEHLALWAQRKGLRLIGTGDFTHPAWHEAIRERLIPAEPGLFRLRDDLARPVQATLPPACRAEVRFALSVEIATIYSQDGRTRKVHHVVLVPDLDAADRLIAALSRIGNLGADGRPILGMRSRDLLEIVLEADSTALLVPAHVWTPWFSALGSKSGFDSIEECYGDLASHIVAVETGLSSDPPMNWRVPGLDRYRLISSSDAHSPAKLGREATVFRGALCFPALRTALATGEGYAGTLEFFPEEGKYHLDGHRKCGLCLTPEETRAALGRCPRCSGLITVGVLARVQELAGRSEAEARAKPPATAARFRSLIPLAEILAEILGVGAGSRQVERACLDLLERLGPELDLLTAVPVEDIRRAGSSLLAEAIARLRAERVLRKAGYDGAYGVIRLFEPGELCGQTFALPGFQAPPKALAPQAPPIPAPSPVPAEGPAGSGTPSGEAPPFPTVLECSESALPQVPVPRAVVSRAGGGLDPDQAAAVLKPGSLLIQAGPGAGKTLVLTHRLARKLEAGVEPEACLAITFTRRAALELRTRLTALDPAGARVRVSTLHALGLELLRAHGSALDLPADLGVASEGEQLGIAHDEMGLSARRARTLLARVSHAKRTGEPLAPADQAQAERYQALLSERRQVDLEDLVRLPAALLEACPAVAREVRAPLRAIAIDELQDIDPAELRLIGLLGGGGAEMLAIGDPDQSIYGFRGADPEVFARFEALFPGTARLSLHRNYRSARPIALQAARLLSRGDGRERSPAPVVDSPERIHLQCAPTAAAEAEQVVACLERMIGGHTFFSIDSGRSADGRVAELGFSDFAVLYRTDAQADLLIEALARSGIPYQKCSHRPLRERPGVRALLAALPDQAEPSVVRALEGAAARLSGGAETLALTTALELLRPLAQACLRDRARFLEAVALGAEIDTFDARADRVSLLTLHAAKGLEFPVVFVVGCEEGLLPYRPRPGAAVDLAEERRLLYVGMTRAVHKLFLCRAERRGRGASLPSPFLADLDEALLEREGGALPLLRRPRRNTQIELF